MSILPARLFPQSPQSRPIRAALARAFHALARREASMVVIRRQPEPIEVRVCYTPDHTWTSIYRRWPKGTTGPGGACRHCLDCRARGDACLMLVPLLIPRSMAPDFSPTLAAIPVRPT